MHVTNQGAGLAQSLRCIYLLHTHVKKVGENSDVADRQIPEPARRIADPIEEIRFVSIQWLIEQRHAVSRRVCTQVGQRFAQVVQRRLT
jgi:hypothetical protein